MNEAQKKPFQTAYVRPLQQMFDKKNKNIFIYLCISSIEIYLSIPSAFCQCGNPTKRAPMALKKNCGRPTRGYLFSRPEKNHSCTHTHTHATPPPFTAYHAISLPRSREQQRKKNLQINMWSYNIIASMRAHFPVQQEAKLQLFSSIIFPFDFLFPIDDS